jgi:integrase
MRTIRRFYKKYEEPNINNINKFVSESFREKRSVYAKYVFKHYLRFLGKTPHKYTLLVAVKVKPRKKYGVYIPKTEQLKIVDTIKDPDYRMVALIQFITGARPEDVITIKRSSMVLERNGSLRLMSEAKGGREKVLYIPPKYTPMVKDYFDNNNNEYPFIKGLSKKGFIRLVDNNYQYYYNALSEASHEVGHPDFRPHDFRRNFANDLDEAGYSLREIQEALGHARIETTARYPRPVGSKKIRDAIDNIRS